MYAKLLGDFVCRLHTADSLNHNFRLKLTGKGLAVTFSPCLLLFGQAIIVTLCQKTWDNYRSDHRTKESRDVQGLTDVQGRAERTRIIIRKM